MTALIVLFLASSVHTLSLLLIVRLHETRETRLSKRWSLSTGHVKRHIFSLGWLLTSEQLCFRRHQIVLSRYALQGFPANKGKLYISKKSDVSVCCFVISYTIFVSRLPIVIKNTISWLEYNSTKYLSVMNKRRFIIDLEHGNPEKVTCEVKAIPY